MVEDTRELDDVSADDFDCIQEDDGASDDETDSFKSASEQAYKQHLEEQSRRQSLRPSTAPTRPQTPSSADRKRRAVEQQDERFRVRPETPRVDYIPPAVRQHSARSLAADIDHAAWGSWLSPGCSYAQLMGPKSGRPATAYAPRKHADGSDVSGKQDRIRQPWQDVKPCDVNSTSGRHVQEAHHRQPYGEEALFAGSATSRHKGSPYLASRKHLRRLFSASVADKRRKVQVKASPPTALFEAFQRRRKDSRIHNDRPDTSPKDSMSTSLDGRRGMSSNGQADTCPEERKRNNGAAERNVAEEPTRPKQEAKCGSDTDEENDASSAPRSDSSDQRRAQGKPFMASIEERLLSMSILDAQVASSDVRMPASSPLSPSTISRAQGASQEIGATEQPLLTTERTTDAGCGRPEAFPTRPFTAGISRPELNPPNRSRPATAPVSIPSLAESFSRLGLATSQAGTCRSADRTSATKAPSIYTRRVLAPPHFVQLTPGNAKLVEGVSEKITEANKLSRALGLFVRYSLTQNDRREVWVEVYEARALVHTAASEQGLSASALDCGDVFEEEPAREASLSATRNADALDPADEIRGSKLRDVSIDVFLRTHRRLHKAATEAKIRGFLSLDEPEPSKKQSDGEEKLKKKEVWEELGVNKGFAKILAKAREHVIQDKYSIANSGRSSAVRGRLVGSTHNLTDATDPVAKSPNELFGSTRANVAMAMGTFSNFGLAVAQRQDMTQKLETSTQR